MGSIPWTIAFGMLFRTMLMSEHDAKLKANHKFSETDIKWDEKTTITYPLICTLAGVFAGLFGVGGGIVKGPLMLEMGEHREGTADARDGCESAGCCRDRRDHDPFYDYRGMRLLCDLRPPRAQLWSSWLP